MKLVYVIGEPGVGKSTLMAGLTGSWQAVPYDKPVPHILYPERAALQLGRERAFFAGTDAMALDVQPRAVEFLRGRPAAVVLGEGDRLGNRRFFHAVSRFCDLRVVWLVGPRVAAERREARALAIGREQDAAWAAGRRSKVRNLADLVSVRIDASQPLNRQVALLAEEVKR